MKHSQRLGLLAALVLSVGLSCQIADLLADKPTPPPVVQSTAAVPTIAPLAAPTATQPTAIAAPPTAPVAAPPTAPVAAPTTAPTAAAQSPCTNPNIAITSPGMDSTVSGLIEIRGTGTKPDMDYWKVEFRPDNSTSYTTLNNSDKAVTDGILARLSTKTMPNGVYFVRLVVVQKDGNFATPCEIRLTISN